MWVWVSAQRKKRSKSFRGRRSRRLGEVPMKPDKKECEVNTLETGMASFFGRKLRAQPTNIKPVLSVCVGRERERKASNV